MKKLLLISTLAFILYPLSFLQAQPTNTPVSALPTASSATLQDMVVVLTNPGTTNARLYKILLQQLRTILGTNANGLSNLAQMLDTSIVAPAVGDFLQYSTGPTAWHNGPLKVLGTSAQIGDGTTSTALTILTNASLTLQPGSFAVLQAPLTILSPGWIDVQNYLQFDSGSYIQDQGNTKHWNFEGTPNGNTVAARTDVTNLCRTVAVQSINSNAVMVIDLSTIQPMLLMQTAPNYNLTLIVTNAAAGRSRDFSILGPAGSNSVTWIWEPWARARWPADPYSLLPVTNNYLATNCYLECSVKCYDTNEIRISAALFK